MRKFKAKQLHSGTGVEGEKRGIVKSRKQAVAIALSACGKADYSDSLKGLGFSEESADFVAQMISDSEWAKQFETGSMKGPSNNGGGTIKAKGLSNLDIDSRPSKQKGNQGKVTQDGGQEGLMPAALPKGNPQPGPRSIEQKGFKAFQEPAQGLTPAKICPPKKPKKPPEIAKQTESLKQSVDKPEQVKPPVSETEKAEKKRKKCIPADKMGKTTPVGITS
jgi:hypothetical protein